MWSAFVDIFRASILTSAHIFGGSIGGGILFVSFALRLALLPWMLKIARRAMAQQRKLVALQPQLERLQKRHAQDPARLFTETRALHKRHGVRIVDPTSLAGGLVQMPLLGALFSAVRGGLGAGVRFAWIADLARPDRILILVVVALSAWVASLTPVPAAQQSAVGVMVVVAGLAALAFVWSTSSAIALSWGAGSCVSALQALLLRREYNRLARAG